MARIFVSNRIDDPIRMRTSQIEVNGLGEDVPVASNDTAIGRQLNRRSK